MKKNSLVILFLGFTLVVFSQEKDQEKLNREARADVRAGNEFYNQLKFAEAEVEYKKALSKNPSNSKASYNLGNALYMQDRNEEAIAQFEILEKMAPNKMSKAEAYHNMGNSLMKSKQYDKAVAAYKNSLRNNSKDEETRYNLALAQKLLQDQQDQDNQDNKDDKDDKGGEDDKNKDKDKNEDKKDKEDGDKGEDQKDKEKDEQGDKSDQQKDKDKQEKEDKQQQPRPNQLSPEQMNQLLEAMNNEENKTQQKLNEQQTQGVKINQEKDW